jgi:Na+-driven multidrug efflux pump
MIAFGFTGGLTVITAQRFGAKDADGVRSSVFHSLCAAFALSVIMTLILVFSLKSLLRIMNVPAEIFQDAYDFMFVLSLSSVMIILYNLMSGFVRALGDSKTPLYFLIFSSIINIILNFMFIYHFHWGVVGSATGTLIANTVSVITCGLYMWHKFPLLRLQKKYMRFNGKILKEHLNIAVPMAIQFSILSFGITIVQSVCNSFGPQVIAAFATALRIEQFATQPLLAIGLAVATFSAQNWGANLLSRIRKGVKYSVIISTVISICGFLLVRKIGQNMISLFIDNGDEFIIQTGKKYLVISTQFYIFLGFIFIFRNAVQGMGKPIVPLCSSIIELLTRSFAAIYLAKNMGYTGIFYASPISWTSAGLFVLCGYFYYIHKFSKEKLRWKIGAVRQHLRKFGPQD